MRLPWLPGQFSPLDIGFAISQALPRPHGIL